MTLIKRFLALFQESRTLGALEVASRDEFTHTHHHLENRVEERSGPVTRSLKPGFKAALGVGVAALSVASGGIGSGIVGSLATTALTSSAVSFVMLDKIRAYFLWFSRTSFTLRRYVYFKRLLS